MRKLLNGRPAPADCHIYTKSDFLEQRFRIYITDELFQAFVLKACEEAKPEVIFFDTLAHLVGGKYHEPSIIHEVTKFMYELQERFNCAVIIAAHPKKRGKGYQEPKTLEEDPEAFFEECMGSSHFINSTGSLWGVERDQESGRTYFVGGTQRLTGTQAGTILEKGDDDWFHIVDVFDENFKIAVSSKQRKAAWDLLPDTPFTEGRRGSCQVGNEIRWFVFPVVQRTQASSVDHGSPDPDGRNSDVPEGAKG